MLHVFNWILEEFMEENKALGKNEEVKIKCLQCNGPIS